MAIFLESPWPLLLIGTVLEAVLALFLLRTGQGKYLAAILGVGAVLLGGLAVERFVVTDRERVEHTLDAAVAAVKANDIQRLLDCLSPSAQNTREEARWLLGRVEVTDAWIRELEITVNRLTSPPTAKARFLAVGTGRDRRNEFPYRTFAQKVEVKLRREGDRWLATGYDVEDFSPPQR